MKQEDTFSPEVRHSYRYGFPEYGSKIKRRAVSEPSFPICSEAFFSYGIMLLIICFISLSAGPVFAQALKTDFNVYPEPSLPAIGPAGSKIVDPTFGTTILRITDSNDGPYGRALYSTYPSVNVNSTRVMGIVLSGAKKAKFWVLDPVNFTVSGGTIPSGMPTWHSWFVRWSGANPDVLYGTGSAKLFVFNVATNTNAVLKDFTSVLPAGYQVTQMQQDLADEIFTMNVLNASSVNVGWLVWRRSTNTVLSNITDSTTNETYVDKTGSYLYWIGAYPAVKVYRVGATSISLVATLSTNGFSHNGVGRDIVFASKSSELNVRNLATPNTVMSLFAGYFSTAFQSHHMSLNSNNETFGTMQRHSTTDDIVRAPFDSEILQVALDGSGKVRRICHHRSKTGTGYGYDDTPFANISPDGQFVAFTSNWGGKSGNNRQDLYLVRIPPAGSGTTVPSPPQNLRVLP